MGQRQLTELDRAISALQDPTRRRILLNFYMERGERTVDEVATELGVHRTVAHDHLERLVALGYLSTGQRRGERGGKPAKLYQLAGPQIDVTYPVRRFARLASLLAMGLGRQGSAGVQAAREAGRRYGTTLIGRTAKSPEDVLHELAPLAADYILASDDVILARNCIFREACAEAPEVVCELHAGLLEGALEQAGVKLRTQAFADYENRGCAYGLTPT